jgi:hypothetical protein
VWVAVTFATKPEDDKTLTAFYERVRPDGPGWGPIAAKVGAAGEARGMGVRLRDWALGCALVYLCLFGVGKVILGEVGLGAALLTGGAVCAALLARDLRGVL